MNGVNHVRQLMTRRNEDIMRRVTVLDEQAAQNILTKAVQTVSSLIFNLLEQSNDVDPHGSRPPITVAKCSQLRKKYAVANNQILVWHNLLISSS